MKIRAIILIVLFLLLVGCSSEEDLLVDEDAKNISDIKAEINNTLEEYREDNPADSDPLGVMDTEEDVPEPIIEDTITDTTEDIEPDDEPITGAASTAIKAQCVNEDGDDPDTYGEVHITNSVGTTKILKDTCRTPKDLIEQNCNGLKGSVVPHVCDYKCELGACIPRPAD